MVSGWIIGGEVIYWDKWTGRVAVFIHVALVHNCHAYTCAGMGEAEGLSPGGYLVDIACESGDEVIYCDIWRGV